MNRRAIGYIVTPAAPVTPFIAKVYFEEEEGGPRVRAYVDDGSGQGHAFPPVVEPLITPVEDEFSLRLDYPKGAMGERGVTFRPVTVESWNELAAQRPEMLPVESFSEMAQILAQA